MDKDFIPCNTKNNDLYFNIIIMIFSEHKEVNITVIALTLYFLVSFTFIIFYTNRDCNEKIITTDGREYCGFYTFSKSGYIRIKTNEDKKYITFSSDLVYSITDGCN